MKFKKMFIFMMMALLFTSCESGFEDMMSETTIPPVPSVITKVKEINSTSAVFECDVTSDRGNAITDCGIYWSTNSNPELSGTKISLGTAMGSSESTVDTLTVASTYYVRAYATNSKGTGYGSVITVKTCGYEGPGGGWVFYDKGSYSDGWRYLEAAFANLGQYSWGTDNTTSASGSLVGTGKINTEKIVTTYGGTGGYAAIECKNYRGGGYDDWFLPSTDEFNLMYNNLIAVGWGAYNFSNALWVLYWTSKESSSSAAWMMNISPYTGIPGSTAKSGSLSVRPIRSF